VRWKDEMENVKLEKVAIALQPHCHLRSPLVPSFVHDFDQADFGTNHALAYQILAKAV